MQNISLQTEARERVGSGIDRVYFHRAAVDWCGGCVAGEGRNWTGDLSGNLRDGMRIRRSKVYRAELGEISDAVR